MSKAMGKSRAEMRVISVKEEHTRQKDAIKSNEKERKKEKSSKSAPNATFNGKKVLIARNWSNTSKWLFVEWEMLVYTNKLYWSYKTSEYHAHEILDI